MSTARRAVREADRRTRRRPAIIASGLAFGLIATAAFTAATPAAEAEPTAAAAAPSYTLASLTTTIQPSAAAAATGTDVVATEALAALAAADATITAAGSVTADIASSGLDLGVPDTTVDTVALTEAAAQLDAADALPAPLQASVTDEVTELVESANSRVAELRGSLEGAQARKAEEEAAEKARVEAEAAAAKAAEEAAAAKAATPAAPRSTSGAASAPAPAPVPVTGGGSGDNSPGGAQATARGMLASRGWGDDQFGCLQSLWQKESGWNYQAMNRSSGAFGIPQALPGSKMASAGGDWQTNAATQISWGFGYIQSRYGTPCSAWSHSQSVGWY